MTKSFKGFVAIVMVLMMAFPAVAQSLWEDRDVYGDKKPSRVGDIVNVMVDESTRTIDEGKSKSTKDDDSNVGAWSGLLSFVTGFGLNGRSTTKGDSKLERKHYVTTNISCVVTEVLPGGNLVILGTRNLITNDEDLRVNFTGVVRPQDIDYKNTIQSSRVANAEVRVQGKGTISRVQKPGVFTQIMQAVF